MTYETDNFDPAKRYIDATLGEIAIATAEAILIASCRGAKALNLNVPEPQPQPVAGTTANGGAKYLKGEDAIAKYFGVARSTVREWRASWLAPAIKRVSKTIFCDAELATQLFEERAKQEASENA